MKIPVIIVDDGDVVRVYIKICRFYIGFRSVYTAGKNSNCQI